MQTFLRCMKTPLIRRFMQFFAALLMALTYNVAHATEPEHLNITLEGCRVDVGQTFLIYPNGNLNPPLCIDSLYTTGNLGKGWNELDLVPHRLTLSLGSQTSATEEYDLTIAHDNEKAGVAGYDVITEPTLNPNSDAGCSFTYGVQETGVSVSGGADNSIFRRLHINQPKGSTCIIDWTARLALGSAQYSGASLHANAANEFLSTSGIGARDISIPVKEIIPQELSKDMSATQDSRNVWEVSKTSNPANVEFGDTCFEDPAANPQPVTVHIEWQILETVGDEVMVVTNVYATNNAHRVITVNVDDEIRGNLGAGDVHLETVNSGDIDVAANSTEKVITHVFSAPAHVTGLHDIATATYIDKITQIPVPGNTNATASADIQQGTLLNETAVITDVENISGLGLSYSVESFVGATGAYQDGYIEGTVTSGQVSWKSDTQYGSGEVTFSKLVYLDKPRNTNGILSDTAYLLGSDGYEDDASASSLISATATSELTIHKSIDIVPDDDDVIVFKFDVTGLAQQEIAFGPGETSKSLTLSGLAQGVYDVTEIVPAGWTPLTPSPQSFNFGSPEEPICVGEVFFENEADLANAKAIKVTDPTGAEAGWTMELRDGEGNVIASGVTDAAGEAGFNGLGEGFYSMTEVQQEGWDLTSVVPEGCTFEVDLPADANQTFECTFTNVQRGRILIEKLYTSSVPDDRADNFEYLSAMLGNFNILAEPGVEPNCGTGVQCVEFNDLLPTTDPANPYNVAEDLAALVDGVNFASLTCEVVETGADDTPDSVTQSAGEAAVNIFLAPGETVKCRFVNEREANPGSIFIEKYVVGPNGTTVILDRDALFSFDATSVPNPDEPGGLLPPLIQLETVNGFETTAPLFTNVVAGNHTVIEQPMPGYTLDRVECTESPATGAISTGAGGFADISLDDGETITCAFYNKPWPVIRVIKELIPADDDGLFNLLVDGGVEAGPVGHGGDTGFVIVDVGEHSVSETGADGTDLFNYVSSTSCDNGAASNSTGVSVGNLDYNDRVTCTITNTRKGRIIVRKHTDPAGDLQEFEFDASYGGFFLADGEQNDSGPLAPGAYSVGEVVPAGWDLVNTECSSSNGDEETADNISLQAGETVECHFYNVKRGKVIVEKRTIGGNAEFLFSGVIDAVLSDGQTAFEEVRPGEYLEHEAQLLGWDLVGLECDDENSGPYGPNGEDLNGGYAGSAIYRVEPGEVVTCVFTNRRRANLIVEKVTVSSNPADHTTDFSYSAAGQGLPGNFLLDGVAADDGVPNVIAFKNLIPGVARNVTEAVPAGWDLTGLECQLIPGTGLGSSNWNTGGALAEVTLAAGDTVKCTYTNTKQIMIDLLKTFNGLVDPNREAVFELYKGGFGGTLLATENTLGDEDGVLDFGNIYLPALDVYTVCERNIPVGTTANWSLNGVLLGMPPVYNPDAPLEDLGNRCVDFGYVVNGESVLPVAPGETLSLAVDNERPEGDRRTPGYWKNWNACTNGNQAENAARNGGFEEGFWLLEDVLPQTIGSVVAETCEEGVAILDSRSLSNGKKMAKFADFTLSRALLAAKLNIAAGSSSCAAIFDVINDADTLLIEVGYNASSGKIGNRHPRRGEALYLAGILDDFNNNLSCGP